VLLGGLWYARAGSLRGRIVWLGALAYMAYMWASTGLAATYVRELPGTKADAADRTGRPT